MGTLAATESEVSSRATRRRFNAEYKRKVLQEADACKKPGDVSALLRREGLYSSHLASWRALRERGELAGLTPQKRGPKARPSDERDRKIAELERHNAQLETRLENAELIIDIQKKVSLLLGVELPPDPRRTEKK